MWMKQWLKPWLWSYFLYIGDYMYNPHLLVGIVVNHYKDHYETTRIQWKGILGTKIPCGLGIWVHLQVWRKPPLANKNKHHPNHPTAMHKRRCFSVPSNAGFPEPWCLAILGLRVFTYINRIHTFFNIGEDSSSLGTWHGCFVCWKLFTTY